MNNTGYHKPKINQKIQEDIYSILTTDFNRELSELYRLLEVSTIDSDKDVYITLIRNIKYVSKIYFTWYGECDPRDIYVNIRDNKEDILNALFDGLDVNYDNPNLEQLASIEYIKWLITLELDKKNDFFEQLLYLGSTHNFADCKVDHE